MERTSRLPKRVRGDGLTDFSDKRKGGTLVRGNGGKQEEERRNDGRRTEEREGNVLPIAILPA